MARALAGGHTPIWKGLRLGVRDLKHPRKVQGLDSTLLSFHVFKQAKVDGNCEMVSSCNCPERVAFSGGGRAGRGAV